MTPGTGDLLLERRVVARRGIEATGEVEHGQNGKD
jgi:hypothetical protein